MEPSDEPALVALEHASPEGGRVAVRIEPGVGYLDLVARYPGVRGYIALVPDDPRVVGMLFSSVAPTQLNGAVVPGAYLFSLRVHPAARRRGLASALIAHARQRAREQAGVELVWAAVMTGNEASLRTFARAGFVRTRDLVVRVRLPSWRRPSGEPAWMLRTATEQDLPALAECLNRANAEHNLWRPCTPEGLADQLVTAGHNLDDVSLVVDRSGRILAGGAALDLRRAFHFRFLGHRGLPAGLNRLLAPFVSHLPLHPLLLRQRALFPWQPRAGLSLLRSFERQAPPIAVLAAPVDPRDPAWPLIAAVTTLSRPLHVVVRCATPLDERRPLCLT